MKPRRELRAIGLRVVAKLAHEARTERGYDEAFWCRRTKAYLCKHERLLMREVRKTFEDRWVKQLVDAYIHSSRDANIEGEGEELRWVTQALTQRPRFVRLREHDGSTITKDAADCTAAEHDRVADQYEKSGAPFRRRARFHRRLAEQLRSASVEDATTLRMLL